MKKKILSLALVVALIAIMVGGSLAYFTDRDQVTNTFTIGSVRIEIFENDEATDDDTIAFGPLTPVVNVDNPSEDVSYIDKVVEVKNTGNNDAYVRVHIAIPTKLSGFLNMELNLADEGWTCYEISTAVVDGVEYDVYTYDYMGAVEPGEFTDELLKGVYLASDVDLMEDEDTGNLVFVRRGDGYEFSEGFVAHTKNEDGSYTSANINILVAAQAIQADGFNNGATDALNAGFATHPWPVA